MRTTTSPHERRAKLRTALRSGALLRFPGAFNPLTAVLIQRLGFEGVYVSGAALSADLALPDIGLTTLTEVATRSQQISRVTDLPTIVDADTGFGEPMNAARTVTVLEDQGLAGCHIEDQVNPKRCGHLDGKAVVETPDMLRRIAAAVSARRDPNFLICARTDVRTLPGGLGGMVETIKRAKAYADAGADMIFPEALANAVEFEALRAAIDVPILANMTEFGKSELLTTQTLESLGVNVVIYPVSTLRLAMQAVENGLRDIVEQGTQARLVPAMQTRSRLYELLGYAEYADFDTKVFNAGVVNSGSVDTNPSTETGQA